MGLLVGGIRVMDPPGWGDYGYMTMIVKREVGADRFELRIVDPMTKDQEENPAADDRDRSWVTVLWYQPMAELSDKPWFVGQVLCGPIALGAAWVSVQAARPRGTNAGNADAPMQAAAISHARSWEIGTLYTAVAGMLNLLVMIDAAFRSDQLRTGLRVKRRPKSFGTENTEITEGTEKKDEQRKTKNEFQFISVCPVIWSALCANVFLVSVEEDDLCILADYILFFDPLPIWSSKWIWPTLLLPLSAGVAVVYKAIRCKDMSKVPGEAAGLFVLIVLGMVLAAGALAGLAKFME